MRQAFRGTRPVRQNADQTTDVRSEDLLRPPRNRAWFLMLLLAVGGCQNGFDLWGPTIAIEQDRPIGLAPTPVLVSAVDNKGVVALTVKLRDSDTQRLLLNRAYEPASPSVTEELLLSSAVDVSPQNQIILVVTARDSSGHTTSQEVAVPYSEKVPEVSVVSAPSSLNQGDPAVAIIQAKGEAIESAGLMVGSTTIPGMRLGNLKMGAAPDHFLVLFSAPTADDRSALRAYGRNSALNTHSVPVSVSVLPNQPPDKRIRMKDDEIAELISSTTSSLRRETNLLDSSVIFSKTGLDLGTPFNAFFGPIFEVNKSWLTRLLRRKTSSYDYMKAALLEPAGGLIAPLASRITILSNDKEYPLGPLPFEVRELGSLSVESVGEGRVLFNENLGPLGTVVGVDMGMGLVVAYGLLESSPLSVGTRVVSRSRIGVPHRRPGASFGTYLIGAFIGGRPANLANFSDEEWFQLAIGKHLAS